MHVIRSLLLSATFLLLASCCTAVPGPASVAPAPVAEVIVSPEAVRNQMIAVVRQHYKPSLERMVLRVDPAGSPLELPPSCVIEVESGSGHGFSLDFIRIELADGLARIEKVEWRDGYAGHQPTRVQRSTASAAQLQLLLQQIRCLPTFTLREEDPRLKENELNGLGGWMTTSDFFILVRVLDTKDNVLFCREFCGYSGSRNQLDYLPLRPVDETADALLEKIGAWQTVAGPLLRTSHFTGAFNRNQELMKASDYWWVMENSVDALAEVGTPAALPTLRVLRDNASGLMDRQKKKIDQLLSAPDNWLTGEPKVWNPPVTKPAPKVLPSKAEANQTNGGK